MEGRRAEAAKINSDAGDAAGLGSARLDLARLGSDDDCSRNELFTRLRARRARIRCLARFALAAHSFGRAQSRGKIVCRRPASCDCDKAPAEPRGLTSRLVLSASAASRSSAHFDYSKSSTHQKTRRPKWRKSTKKRQTTKTKKSQHTT